MGKLLVVILACLLTLCGCASTAVDQPPEVVTEDEAPTLIWWCVGPPPNDLEAGMESINAYLMRELGIRLDLRLLSWDQLATREAEVVNTGEYFDIMFVHSGNFRSFASLGALQDITDMLRADSPGLWKLVPDLVWSGAKLDGRIYAVPTYKDCAMTQYWVFDAQYVDKYGIDLDQVGSWDSLDGPLRQIKQGEGADFYPLLMSLSGQMAGVFNGFDSFSCGIPLVGVRVDDPTRTVVCTLEDPEIIERLALLREWYLDGIINPDANTVSVPDAPRPVFSGIGWPGAESVWERSEGVDKYYLCEAFGPYYTTESIQGSMNAISSGSQHKQAALKLLDRINTDHKLRDMFAYGVEGRNFEYVSDNVVRQLNADWSVHAFAQASLFTMSTPEGNDPDQWERLRAINEGAAQSVLLGFEMDVGDLITEISACASVWDGYGRDLLVGAADPGVSVPRCVEALRAAGLDLIISEAQKQIDAYFGVDAGVR